MLCTQLLLGNTASLSRELSVKQHEQIPILTPPVQQFFMGYKPVLEGRFSLRHTDLVYTLPEVFRSAGALHVSMQRGTA